MNDWTAGYVADIGYTYGYYPELNPMRVKLAFLSAGLMAPKMGTACELGFGQGISANLHAAASITEWYGTDFNPSQAGFARELAGVSGANAALYDESFAEFAARADLPQFDYIGLHGIWSWISDQNRSIIVEFIRRKLKVGGVLYISYNTLPGWSVFAPMRHLLTSHAELLGAEGRGIVSRIDEALDFSEKLLATQPNYLRANPLVAERLAKIKEQNRHYLAHEYFNRDWHPMHFSTMAEWLKPAKVQYACSANYIDHVNAVNLTPEQQIFLKEIPDLMFRETVRDYMVNQQFRKDYWVKGLRKMSVVDQSEHMRSERVILISHRPDIPLQISGALGEANMSTEVYDPILDYLADHKSRTLGQIEQAVKDRNISFAHVMEAIILLAGAGHLGLVQDDGVTLRAKKHSDKLNAYLLDKARGGNDIHYLASPVTGGGVSVGRFQQLFLLAMSQGQKQANELAQSAWQTIGAQGHKILKDGKPLESAEENLAELVEQARVFLQKQLPILRTLQV